MEQNNIILVGGGGHCKYVIDVAESVVFNIVGICMKSVQTPYNTYMCENVSRENTIFCEENQSTETEHNVIITSLSY